MAPGLRLWVDVKTEQLCSIRHCAGQIPTARVQVGTSVELPCVMHEWAAASHLQVPSIEKLPGGQVLQDRPLVSDSSTVLGKNKTIYFTVVTPEGGTPL